MLTPQQFVEKWRNTPLKERQSYQLHFMDVCQLVGHETPGGEGTDSQGRTFAFEYGVKKDVGGQGFADVFYDGRFAIEYKAPGKYKDLDAAYQQLLQYRERLNNPPLLVVTDIQNWEIHTNWPATEKKVYKFTHDDIANRPSVQKYLRDLFQSPDRLHPKRNTEQVTTDAADVFRVIAEDMRRERGAPAERIAHFLTKLVFCLFAEDAALLPSGPKGETGIFAEIVENTLKEPSRFIRYTRELFEAMANGGEVMFQKIPYFNGSLFDDVEVEELSPEALGKLGKAANLNWESVEPAIFGTLFERSLDPSKRAQLGAHYTGREDILLIVEPVLMQPLRREWEQIKLQAAPIREKFETALKTTNRRDQQTHQRQLENLRETMLKRLREIKVLDPACGSGNFLYVSLQLLMDMEKEVLFHELWTGLTLPLPAVHPHQMYGIEINPIAHDLASIVVWIGYIQWRKNNGYYQAFGDPILQDLSDNIRLMDSVMTPDNSEPEWPEVDVIVGNPPFLGGNRIRGELGNDYVDKLFKLYEGRVPAFADLVCYWFEKARAHLEQGKAKRAGLLATNSIRGGVNREVLKRIKESGDIFMAWSDREWVLDGAAVRVSMVGFDGKSTPLHAKRGGVGGGEELPPLAHTRTSTELWEKIKPLAREMRKEPTPAEEKLWGQLRGKRILDYKFRRQHPIDRFIVDFYCAEARLVIEVDGAIHDFTQEADALRQAFIESLGIRVLRFSNGDVLQHTDGVLERIAEVLQEGNTPHPQPLPASHGGEQKMLDGRVVSTINPDLTASVDITTAKHLVENENLCFMGPSPKAPFDIDYAMAQKMLAATNASGRSNTHVVRPVVSGIDIVRQSRSAWTIDFSLMSIEDAQQYEMPFKYVEQHVYPVRSQNRRASYAEKWWQYAEARPGLRQAIENKSRFIVTPALASYRIFIWGNPQTLYNQQVLTFACEDDYFFGVLHSRIHEVWALRMGTSLEDRPRYTPTTTFETFPFPWSPGQEDVNSPAYQAVSTAAKQLHEERDAWLNAPQLSERERKDRTLTNLYNALNVWRGKEKMKVKDSAGDFAPRLAALHDALDAAVCAAYGWDVDVLGDEEAILSHLLALNTERSQS